MPSKQHTQDLQRRQALANANMVRGQRAVVKRSLKAAPNRAAAFLRLLQVIEGRLPGIENMQLLDLVRACKGVGTFGAAQMMKTLQVSGHRQLQDLSERQREALTEYLKGNIPSKGDLQDG